MPRTISAVPTASQKRADDPSCVAAVSVDAPSCSGFSQAGVVGRFPRLSPMTEYPQHIAIPVAQCRFGTLCRSRNLHRPAPLQPEADAGPLAGSVPVQFAASSGTRSVLELLPCFAAPNRSPIPPADIIARQLANSNSTY